MESVGGFRDGLFPIVVRKARKLSTAFLKGDKSSMKIVRLFVLFFLEVPITEYQLRMSKWRGEFASHNDDALSL